MIRLAKYIAGAGYCSRRAACRLIEAGEVLLNGRPALHTDRVSLNDQVVVQGQRLKPVTEYHYFLFNKPVGVDCVCNPSDPDSILHFMPSGEGIPRLFPVGRLDKDSHGLMLLTNHGELCQRLLHPDFYHEKEYRVVVDQPLTEGFFRAMAAGVEYGGIQTRPCQIYRVNDRCFNIILTQGLNRQIRRMCKALGYKVVDLQRVRLMSICLSDLPCSYFRVLTAEELQLLFSLLV